MKLEEAKSNKYGTFRDGLNQEKVEFNAEASPNQILTKRFLLMNVLFICIYGLIIGTDFVYKDALFDLNARAIPDLQSDDKFLNKFMEILGYFGEIPGVILT